METKSASPEVKTKVLDVSCPVCAGTGTIYRRSGFSETESTCGECFGTGSVEREFRIPVEAV